MLNGQPQPTEKDKQQNDNPALSQLIERNIRTIIHLRTKVANKLNLQDDLADLEMETKPEDVLAEIQRLQEIELKKRKIS